MAELQYIGARYVPKFATPFEWDIRATYEPLTIVGFHGNSYTSKKAVPAGVEINNDEYWALTSSTSGGINDLTTRVTNAENEIDTLQTITDSIQDEVTKNTGDITALNNKIENIKLTGYKIPGMRNVIFIGDSYATTETSWPVKLAPLLGLKTSNYVTKALSGRGYADREGTSFYTLLQEAISGKSAEWISNVTHIVIAHAGNDRGYVNNPTSITDGISLVANFWKTNLPNATCYNMNIGRDIRQNAKFEDLSTAYAIISEKCYEVGIIDTPGTVAALYLKSWFNTDGRHPNGAGSTQLAYVIYQALRNGTVSISSPFYRFTSDQITGFTIDRARFFYEYVNNGIVTIGHSHRFDTLTLTTPITDSGMFWTVGTFNSRFINGNSTAAMYSWPCMVVDTENNFHNGFMYIGENNSLIASIGVNAPGVASLRVPSFSITTPLTTC